MINEFNFYYAINGKDALQKLDILPKPDVIISDIMMDTMDGHEFLHGLREKRDMQDIPFIFLTAKGSESDILKGLQLGAIDYVIKPFTIPVLKEKIKALIRDHIVFTEKESEKQDERLLDFLKSKRNRNNEENKYVKFNQKLIEYNLSNREREILIYLLEGLGTKEMSEKLFISANTVRTHIQNIREKCGVRMNSQLMGLFQHYSHVK